MVINSTDDILNALIAKGVLTEEEGALLQKGRTGEKEAAEKKKETSVSGKVKDGTVVWESGDKSTSLGLTGRLHFDMRNVDEDNNQSGVSDADRDSKTLGNSYEVRRARIGAKGKMFKDFDYEVVANAVGSNTNVIDVAYLNWAKFEPVQLRVGQFKQPFSLEQLTSSNNIDFMERSYQDQIIPAKKPGLMVHGVPTKGLTYAVSTYQQNPFGVESVESDGRSFAGRATLNFAEMAGWKDAVFHVGLSGFNSEYGVLPTSSSNGSSTAPTCTTVDATPPATGYVTTCTNPSVATNGTVFAFRTEGRGLANVYRAQIGGDSVAYGGSMPSNRAAKVENNAYGVELALTTGPFKLQGEYTGQTFDASVKGTTSEVKADVQAFYVEALWMLTGENYSDWYKNGIWSGIKPKSNFDLETGKGMGAWEIGFRYDDFKVDDVTVVGTGSRIQGTQDANKNGGAKTYTAGLKWQLNPNMRMLLNYSHTKFDDAFVPVDLSTSQGAKTVDKEDLLMLRTQVAF